jgi:hypothetical protein
MAAATLTPEEQHEAMHAALQEATDANRDAIGHLRDAMTEESNANSERDGMVMDLQREVKAVKERQTAQEQAANTAGGLPPFVVATLRAFGAAILAGGGAALLIAPVTSDGKALLLAFAGGALGAFGWRGPVEGSIDQKSASK